MSIDETAFAPLRVSRSTRETRFSILIRPREAWRGAPEFPNRLLAHFLDHFCKATGVEMEIERTDWPGSWVFDHVLCEDIGQMIGRGMAALHAARATRTGVSGRASTSCCLDEARVDVCLSLEERPRVAWSVEPGVDIDGFVDAWYGSDGTMAGYGTGTNLRQFIDGFAQGAGATLHLAIRRGGNLHHLYEAVFRALGDAVGDAIGLTPASLAGDTSGLAGRVRYEVAALAPGESSAGTFP